MDDQLRQYLRAGKKNLVVIYVLYLLGLVLPLLIIIGVVLAYVNKTEIKDDFLYTHYSFVLRTFFIGFSWMFISIITTIILIGPLLYILLVIWFICRIVVGLKYLINDEVPQNYKTFWIK